MVIALAALLLCQLAGEAVSRALGLPVPGPVFGAAMLFLLLLLREKLARIAPREIYDGTLETAATVLLANLSLLFIPAGVGVVQKLDVFRQYGLGLVLALVLSTLIAMVVTVFTFRLVARILGDHREAGAADE